jgi:hypothetical protein
MIAKERTAGKSASEQSDVSESELLYPYSSLEETTRSLIEGVPYADLPQEFTLDLRIYSLLESINQTMLANFEERKKKSAEPSSLSNIAKERVRAYYLAHPEEPDAHLHIASTYEKRVIKLHEFSQKLYLLDQDVYVGEQHEGEENRANRRPKADGIDDELAIIDIHTHPSTSPFSRNDLAIMVKTDQHPQNKCLFLVAAGDIRLAGVVATDAVKSAASELKTEFNIFSYERDEYFADLDKLTLELPEAIEDPKQLQFITQFLDILKKSTPRKVGIYVDIINQPGGLFKRMQTIEEVIALSKMVSGY